MNLWWVWLMLCGGLGTLARYSLGSLMDSMVTSFPLGTVLVNIIGCFLFGVVYTIIDRYALGSMYSVLIITGFLGGFTTFSAYAGQTWLLLQAQEYGLALINVIVSNGCSILGVWGGVTLMRLLVK